MHLQLHAIKEAVVVIQEGVDVRFCPQGVYHDE